jgi:hypothetical protein
VKFYSNKNRIDDAIGRQQGRIDALVESGVDLKGQPIKASLANMDETLALTTQDHADFQKCQSRASAAGTLNTDEALTIYAALGAWHNPDNGGWQDGVNLATKTVVTQTVSELLQRQLAIPARNEKRLDLVERERAMDLVEKRLDLIAGEADTQHMRGRTEPHL